MSTLTSLTYFILLSVYLSLCSSCCLFRCQYMNLLRRSLRLASLAPLDTTHSSPSSSLSLPLSLPPPPPPIVSPSPTSSPLAESDEKEEKTAAVELLSIARQPQQRRASRRPSHYLPHLSTAQRSEVALLYMTKVRVLKRSPSCSMHEAFLFLSLQCTASFAHCERRGALSCCTTTTAVLGTRTSNSAGWLTSRTSTTAGRTSNSAVSSSIVSDQSVASATGPSAMRWSNTTSPPRTSTLYRSRVTRQS